MIEFDTSELRALSADFGDAGPKIAREVDAIIRRGALNIKRDLQLEASGSQHFSGVPRSITYETVVRRDETEAEIGPEIGKGQGSLAFLAYNGTSTMGPVFPDPSGALARESVNTMEWLGRAAEGSL